MPVIYFLTNMPLAPYTSYKIGGPAKYMIEAKSRENLTEAIRVFRKAAPEKMKDKIFVLGGGTNILFSDSGYDGLVVKLSISDIKESGQGIMTIGAGTKMEDIVGECVKNKLTGLEWAGGLPGTLGGAIRGNAGAFHGEMKDSVVSVRSVRSNDIDKEICRSNKECLFGYRTSIFKEKAADEIIISAEMRLTEGDAKKISEETEKNIAYRKEYQPSEYPSAGSVFKNVAVSLVSKEAAEICKRAIKTDPFPMIPAAFLISEAGLKGKTIGGAMISEKHPNFFINHNNATAEDVKRLIAFARTKVKEKFGINLELEIQICPPNF